MNKLNIIKKIILSILLLLAFSQPASAEFFVTNSPGNMASPAYTYSVNLSNASGTNNATHVYGAGHFLPNFTDVYFTDASGNLLSFWVEPYTGRAWVNRTSNTSIKMYYGNTSRTTSTGNPNATFIQWAGANSSEFIQPVQNRIIDVAFDAVEQEEPEDEEVMQAGIEPGLTEQHIKPDIAFKAAYA